MSIRKIVLSTFVLLSLIQQKSVASTLTVATTISTNTQIDQNWINTHPAPYVITGSNITITIIENLAFNSLDQYFIISGVNLTFNGKGKNITAHNMINYQGLIVCNNSSYASSAIIKNIGIIASGSTILGDYCGWIAAGNTNYANITNCFSTGNFGMFAGGIAGYSNFGAINYCYSTGNIGNYSGGIAGYGNRGVITNCYSTGNIGVYGGGIAGYDNGASISNCYSTGNIVGGAGGIAGYDNRSTISNCYTLGNGPIIAYNNIALGGVLLNSFSENGSAWNPTNANLYLLSVGSIWDNTNPTSPYLLKFSDPLLSFSYPSATLTSNCSLVPSAPISLTINGSNISSTVSIIAPSGMEISTISNTSYSTTISITPTLNTISSTIYVRLKAITTNGATGLITASSLNVDDAMATISSTVLSAPSFSPTGPFILCKEATYPISLTIDPNYPLLNSGWATSSSTITVNSSGYVTAGNVTGSYMVSYTDGCSQTVSATVTVVDPSASTVAAVTGGEATYKFDGTTKGPAANIFKGYNGYDYASQTNPISPGFYKANKVDGNNAGCPSAFYIFKCTNCPN